MKSLQLLLALSIYLLFTSLVMALKNTDQASAELIRLKFNMLVLTIQDDLVGLYSYPRKKLAFTLSKKNYLGSKPTEKITWFSGRRNRDGLNPK